MEIIDTLSFIRSSIRLLIRDEDLEIHVGIDRYPFAWVEGEIVPVPFEAFGSVEIIFSSEAYGYAVLIDSFPYILDIEYEILVERDPLLGVFRIDETDAWWVDVRFTFRHFPEIQCECSLERDGLASDDRFRTSI